MASNLPPGVTDSMIPGNRPEDVAFDAFCDRLEGWLSTACIKCDGDQFDVLANLAWDYIDARI